MIDEPLDDLYRDIVLDHTKCPRCRNPLDRVDLSSDGHNPVCGDEVQVCLKVSGDRVEDICVRSRGCSISTASGSIMAENVKGKTREETEKIIAAFRSMIHGNQVPDSIDLGELEALEGVHKFPIRVKCAMLAWVTLESALKAWDEGKVKAEQKASTE